MVSHRSAALLAGLPVLTMPGRACLTAPPGTNGSAVTAHLHRAQLSAGDVVGGPKVARTASARTVVDIARESGVAEALVVADAALRCGRVTRAQLALAVDRQQAIPGAVAARALVPCVDGRSESPLETMSRLRLADAGVARPELQTTLTDSRGAFLARSDFYWDAYGVVGEADGISKYDSIDVVVKEKLRQERLENCGLIVVRWGWTALTDIDRLVTRLHSAFHRGRQRHGARSWRAVSPAREPDAPIAATSGQ